MCESLALLTTFHFFAPQQLLADLSRPDAPVPLHMYVDLHAHVCKRGAFLFGNLPASDEAGAIDALAFPRLVALHSPYFDVSQCEFAVEGGASGAGSAASAAGAAPPDADEEGAAATGATQAEGDKEGTGRIAVSRATRCPRCFTVEMNYAIGKNVFSTPPASNDGGRASPPFGARPSARSFG